MRVQPFQTKGPTSRTATNITVAQILDLGEAGRFSATGGTVTVSDPLSSGSNITYAVDESDANDGVIMLNITAQRL